MENNHFVYEYEDYCMAEDYSSVPEQNAWILRGDYERHYSSMYYGENMLMKYNSTLEDRIPQLILASPSKMMSDHSLISDNAYPETNFLPLKSHLEEIAATIDTSQINNLFCHDANFMIEHAVVDAENENSHGDVMTVHNLKIKQEDDVIHGDDIIVDGEVEIDDHIDSHFDIASSVDIGSESIEDTGFDESKLVIDDNHSLLMGEEDLKEEYEENDEHLYRYSCTECDVLFKSKSNLRSHTRNTHPKIQKTKSKKYNAKEKVNNCGKHYYCTSCDYSSLRRDKLDKHMEKHVLEDGVHPCGKRRHKPDTLPQRHRHNPEEYKCKHCPYVCTVMKAMKKHQKIHKSNLEAFPLMISCKICGKDRPSESEMQRHLKKHKKGNRFCCDLCPFTSVQLKKIIQHHRAHTGEKPHLCPHCAYRSARRDNLRSHVRRMHKKTNMYIDTFNPNEDWTFS
ncbi:zinc finger protein 407 [Caerostris extrusa]|uniref:Zinc finger protein 407 n=1 Tax=Caerostris extrusa TaxID=172846 RepID=A0AAV4PSW7_CAEEX|nr:zinc finger protein 407 [Caerostris extrusa]